MSNILQLQKINLVLMILILLTMAIFIKLYVENYGLIMESHTVLEQTQLEISASHQKIISFEKTVQQQSDEIKTLKLKILALPETNTKQ